MIAVYRPPRNTICPSCYEGAKGMIEFLKEADVVGDGGGRREATNSGQGSHGSRPKTSMASSFVLLMKNSSVGFLEGNSA